MMLWSSYNKQNMMQEHGNVYSNDGKSTLFKYPSLGRTNATKSKVKRLSPKSTLCKIWKDLVI